MRRLIAQLLLSLVFSYGFSENCCIRGFDVDFETDEKPTLLAFVSLSIPEASLIEMSKHLEKIGGQFIFRGTPNHSFEAFLKIIMDLRKKGVLASILVDPESFEEYGVTEVPTFVLLKGETFEKIVGNVSIPFALEKLKEIKKKKCQGKYEELK